MLLMNYNFVVLLSVIPGPNSQLVSVSVASLISLVPFDRLDHLNMFHLRI